MSTVKENIIKEIQEINNERLLPSIQSLLHSIREADRHIETNSEQKNAVEEARAQYSKGNYLSTDDLFNELMND